MRDFRRDMSFAIYLIKEALYPFIMILLALFMVFWSLLYFVCAIVSIVVGHKLAIKMYKFIG